MRKIKPQILEKGDTIGIISPSGNFISTNINKAIHLFQKMGYKVWVDNTIRKTTQRGYFAGTDKERAESLNNAFRNPEVDAIFTTGSKLNTISQQQQSVEIGIGSLRILPLLDYDAIRDNPKIFTGISDVTSLHLAISKKTGLITFHGPSAGEIGGEFPDYNKDYLFRAIASKEPIGEIVNPVDGPYIKTITEGKVTGELIGGNSSSISSSMSTPYELDMQGKILFIENIAGRPESYVERELTQLRLAGKLQKCAGIIYGEDIRTEMTRGQSIMEVMRDRIGDLGIPAIYDLCFGHTKYKCTLPIGVKATLDATNGKLIIEESAVS